MRGFGLPSFYFKAPATAGIYTLSLHDALPISGPAGALLAPGLGPAAGDACPVLRRGGAEAGVGAGGLEGDRKSTRLNSSHVRISYAVFCLKKKTFPNQRPGRALRLPLISRVHD